LSHTYTDISRVRRQLQSTANLVPVASWANSVAGLVDPITGQFKRGNILDRITYYNRSAVEYYQLGYGDMCYVYDNLIDPINRVMRNEPPVIPAALDRLLQQVDDTLLAEYFPLFAQGKYDFSTHMFEEIEGNCNHECKPSPFYQRYNDTENGRRQVVELRYGLAFDENNYEQKFQDYFWSMTSDLNSARYCNPVVNT
jgi:hypothetical protein